MINNLYKVFISSNLGFWLLIIAAVGDLLIPFLLAPFCSRYSHVTMVMSLLGNRNAPVHSVYNTWLVIAGVMLLSGSMKLYAIYAPVSKWMSVILFVVLTSFAVGACIVSGIFAVGETKELVTLSETIHGYGSVFGFLLLAFAPLLVGMISIRSGQLLTGIVSLIFFVSALIFFSLFVMADKEAYIDTIISYEGLWQRLSLFCMYAPFIIVSCKNLFAKNL